MQTQPSQPARVFTTYIAAHPEDAAAAYAAYKERVAQSSAQIVATSPHFHPCDDAFHLWQLRCEAAYENIPHHNELQLYLARALALADDVTLAEEFYLPDGGPNPSLVEAGSQLTFTTAPQSTDFTIVRPIYLAEPDTLPEAQQAYTDLIQQTSPIAHDPKLAELNVVQEPELVGPLWTAHAATQSGGHCEECTSLHMDAWSGWLLADAEAVQTHQTHQTPAGIFARAVTEAF